MAGAARRQQRSSSYYQGPQNNSTPEAQNLNPPTVARRLVINPNGAGVCNLQAFYNYLFQQQHIQEEAKARNHSEFLKINQQFNASMWRLTHENATLLEQFRTNDIASNKNCIRMPGISNY